VRVARLFFASLGLIGAVSQPALADTREHEHEELARFQHYAGPPIDEFPMFELWQWQVVGPTQLVLWSTIKDAYLIRVEKSCNNLEWTHGLSVTQEMRQKVSNKFDFVVFGNERCKIAEIRPIDYRRMVKEGGSQPPGHDGHSE
jgi:uncharacterized protein DUF6491